MKIFGYHEIPFNLDKIGLSMRREQSGGNLHYQRDSTERDVKKLILGKDKKILINPVEPVNVPKYITPFLLIKLKNHLMLETKISRTLYIKFPIEIGVFVSSKRHPNPIDIFTLNSPKFTLYGDPLNGIICRFYESEVYSELQEVNPLEEGIIELNISNRSSEWIELTQVVFNAHGMKIFYDDTKVVMRASMDIHNKTTAEIDIFDSPLKSHMVKSKEIYSTTMMSIVKPKFIMREGL
ncbi:DUF432 domain-containing protein [Acidobacteriota bacterium]